MHSTLPFMIQNHSQLRAIHKIRRQFEGAKIGQDLPTDRCKKNSDMGRGVKNTKKKVQTTFMNGP